MSSSHGPMGNSTHLSGSSSSLSSVLPLFRDAAKQRGDKQGRDMIGEEVSGPAGPKVLRLLYFVGAGFICAAAINKWRELERKSLQRQQQQQLLNAQSPHSQESPLSKPLD